VARLVRGTLGGSDSLLWSWRGFQLLWWCCGRCRASREERSVPVHTGPARHRDLLTGQAAAATWVGDRGPRPGVHRALHVLRESV